MWWRGWVICAICDRQHVAVIPLPPGEDEPNPGMECHGCGSMSCVVMHDDEEDEVEPWG